MARILLVEDEESIAEVVADNLRYAIMRDIEACNPDVEPLLRLNRTSQKWKGPTK